MAKAKDPIEKFLEPKPVVAPSPFKSGTDAVNSTILPNAGTNTTQKPLTPNTPGVIRSGETGGITGITLANGNTLLGLTPQQVDMMAAQEMQRLKGGTATQAFEGQAKIMQDQQNQQALIQQNAALANQVGSPVAAGQVSPTNLSQVQAGLAGVKRAIPTIAGSVATGAIAGAGIGAVGGAGIGAVPGAIIGALGGLVVGIWNGVTNNLEQQASDVIANQNKVLTDGKRNMNQLIALTKADPQHADRYLAAYQEQQGLISQAYSQLKLDTSRFSFKYLSKDGTKNLQAFENYYSLGGLNDIYNSKMQQALLGQAPDTLDLMAIANDSEVVE